MSVYSNHRFNNPCSFMKNGYLVEASLVPYENMRQFQK